jgi:hypothetical protein
MYWTITSITFIVVWRLYLSKINTIKEQITLFHDVKVKNLVLQEVMSSSERYPSHQKRRVTSSPYNKARFLPFLEHSLPQYTYRITRNTVHQNKSQMSHNTSNQHLRISISTLFDCRISTDYLRYSCGLLRPLPQIIDQWPSSVLICWPTFCSILKCFSETSKFTYCPTRYKNPQYLTPDNICCKSLELLDTSRNGFRLTRCP